jgi:excinuclease UvrABC nuclease subunit
MRGNKARYRAHHYDWPVRPSSESEALPTLARVLKSALHSPGIPEPTVPTTLYRLFDEDDSLIYVGVSVDIMHRLHQHRQKWWWPEVANASFEHFPNRREAEEREREVIEEEAPFYNVVHAIRR